MWIECLHFGRFGEGSMMYFQSSEATLIVDSVRGDHHFSDRCWHEMLAFP